MSKRSLVILLCASLLLNVGVIAALGYVRFYLLPHVGLQAVSTRLALDAAGRQHLIAFRRAMWEELRDSRHDNQAAMADINHDIATLPAGDPAFGAALDRLSSVRRARQERLLSLALAFRDSLPPDSRAQFALMSNDPQFVLELLGLHLDPNKD